MALISQKFSKLLAKALKAFALWANTANIIQHMCPQQACCPYCPHLQRRLAGMVKILWEQPEKEETWKGEGI